MPPLISVASTDKLLFIINGGIYKNKLDTIDVHSSKQRWNCAQDQMNDVLKLIKELRRTTVQNISGQVDFNERVTWYQRD